jgi:GMP synthase (glutamine-hydrolysing)
VADGSSSRPTILVVQHQDNCPPMLLGPAAEAAGLALDVRNVAQGAEVPAGPDGYAGVVVLGGSAGIADAPDAPHLYDEMDLIRATADAGTPFLGICLGAQLAAEALGGSVRRGEDGVEVGWVEVRPTDEGRDDPVAAAAGEGLSLFQWHHDVFEPPPGATPLLTADRYPNQGFRLGEVWAVQAHPEVDASAILAWSREPGGADDLAAEGVTTRELMEGSGVRGTRARRLLDAWCAHVADCASRRAANSTSAS